MISNKYLKAGYTSYAVVGFNNNSKSYNYHYNNDNDNNNNNYYYYYSTLFLKSMTKHNHTTNFTEHYTTSFDFE